MDNFQKWQDRDTSNKNRTWALVIGALIFPVLIPVCLVVALPVADRALRLGSFYHGWANILFGVIAILTGGAFAAWTIVVQITQASGTPFPMLPTKKLLVAGPFKFCRNPMTLGTVIAYAGVAVLAGSYSALVFVALFAAILIAYLILIEEKELLLRFGDEYREYKKSTPFLIPIKFQRDGL
jgi:protein-S-isoprenylcysteine O-methyltransferase Ste14